MSTDKKTEDNEVMSSENLHKELNEERAREGKEKLKAVNPLGGATNRNYSDKDKSFKNPFDFFYKLAKRGKKK
ncbi:MAG: hypothetical protein PHS19_04730 [Eubacteriales bacterium]|nr:hypothetical protein [Eubacteriales bacterium]